MDRQTEYVSTPEGYLVFGRQMTRRDLLKLGLGFGFAAKVLSGCAPAAPTPGPTAPGPAGTAAQGPAKLVNPGTPPDRVSGELRVALTVDIRSLDPIDTYTLNNGRWQSNVYSPLVWRDANLIVYDGKEGRPSPAEGFGLAESWQYLDDRTLEVKLKRGIRFHNGEPLTGDAVRSTFVRLLDKANQSPQAFNYVSIDRVEVVDDYSVRFHFKDVDPVMITKLAGYGAFITPPGAVKDKTRFATVESPGTGPYRVVRYTKDDRLVLEAWDGWWGQRKPHIRTIVYRMIPDDNTRLAEFLAGSIDVLTLNVSQANAAKGNPNVTLVEIGVPTVSGLRLDAKKEPTNRKEVRQAIAHAIDIKTIVETILSGYAKPVGIWQSPFSFGYEDYPPYEFSPEKAKALLGRAGLRPPVKVTYDLIGGDTQQREIANAVKDMLGAVGFEVELRLRERATFYDEYRAGKLGNIVPFGWGGWTLDYDNTYYSMYYTGESYNPSYSNPEVDRLLDEQRRTLDRNKRLEIARQLNKLIYEDYVDVALYQNVYIWGISNRVRNFLIPPDERLFWLDAYVEG